MNAPRDLHSKSYLQRAVVNNAVCTIMRVVLFAVDILMLVMFARFNRSCDEEFEEMCEEKKKSLPIREYILDPKYAHLRALRAQHE